MKAELDFLVLKDWTVVKDDNQHSMNIITVDKDHLFCVIWFCGSSIQLLIFAANFALTIRFFTKTKHVKEVGSLTRILIFMGNVSGISNIIGTTLTIIGYMIKNPSIIVIGFVFNMFLSTIPFAYNLFEWMRLLRVQVQLRARNENTNAIIYSMKNSNRLQYLLLFLIAIITVS